MIKLANKIALSSILEGDEWMEKQASKLAIPAAAGALSGGLVGNSQRNDDDSPWQPLKPVLGALTGAAAGVPGGLAGWELGDYAHEALDDITRKIKNKKAKAILAALSIALPTAGIVGGGAGAGALSGLGISKLIDL